MMATPEELRTIAAIRRSDFREFAKGAFEVVAPGERLCWNWHLDAICYELDLVRRGLTRRLIIEVPPRSLKSFLTSIAYPAFCLGRDPTSKIVTASYSIDLSAKFSNDFRGLVRSLWYLGLFPQSRVLLKDTETEFVTSAGGHRYATSTGGTLTGRGGQLIILDDPLKADDAMSAAKRGSCRDWFCNTVVSRLNNQLNGAIVLVMQRLHIDDLAGYLRAQGGWRILSLPASATLEQSIELGDERVHHRAIGDILQPEREPQHVLDGLNREMGSFRYSAQYQQEPIPEEGELIRWTWFKPFEALPQRGESRIVQSWDIATKAGDTHDYSACSTWAVFGRTYYLLNMYRKRLLFPDLKRAVVEHGRRWRAETILIEDKVSGTALIQQLREDKPLGLPLPIPIVPVSDKVSRMSAETATLEAGEVYIQAHAAWHADLRSELTQFPNGAHDDQVDSISQFLGWARSKRSPSFGTVSMR